MPQSNGISALFLDIGGVLLTNGWDRRGRRAAVEKFDLDFEEVNERHHLTFDTYEEGRLTLHEYLNRVVFYEKRSFSHDDFRQFMFDRSQPYDDMLSLVRNLRAQYNLRTVTVSNEGRELTEYRIQNFGLASMIDAFIVSCFVHTRKPDIEIFKIALNISQARPEEVVYIDDRPMFVEVASTLGIHGIHHENFELTRKKLAEFGLKEK